MMQHPDDVEFHSGTWCDQFATLEDACAYYGAELPSQLRFEAAWDLFMQRVEVMDAMEARGGPQFAAFGHGYIDEEIPF